MFPTTSKAGTQLSPFVVLLSTVFPEVDVALQSPEEAAKASVGLQYPWSRQSEYATVWSSRMRLPERGSSRDGTILYIHVTFTLSSTIKFVSTPWWLAGLLIVLASFPLCLDQNS